MSFDWRQLLEVGRELLKQASQTPHAEAFYRSVVSRVYFGAFGHARRYAADFLGFVTRDDVDDHGRLRAHLRGKRRVGDADRLDLLRTWRNRVDYDDELPGHFQLATKAAHALEHAERIFLSLTPPKKVP